MDNRRKIGDINGVWRYEDTQDSLNIILWQREQERIRKNKQDLAKGLINKNEYDNLMQTWKK